MEMTEELRARLLADAVAAEEAGEELPFGAFHARAPDGSMVPDVPPVGAVFRWTGKGFGWTWKMVCAERRVQGVIVEK